MILKLILTISYGNASVQVKLNKRNHTQKFSAALQIVRCCGRHVYF